MARWYSELEEYSKISLEDKLLRDKIIKVIQRFTKEMEGYSYFGSNPGVSVDDYEDIADEIMLEFEVKGGIVNKVTVSTDLAGNNYHNFLDKQQNP